jgi:predicted transposase YdaD
MSEKLCCVKTMLGLDTELKQTRFYQEIAEEERREGRKEESIALLTRQLRRKFGLQPELEAALQQVPEMELEKLENLVDALLDFKEISDLQAGLNTHNSHQPI